MNPITLEEGLNDIAINDRIFSNVNLEMEQEQQEKLEILKPRPSINRLCYSYERLDHRVV